MNGQSNPDTRNLTTIVTTSLAATMNLLLGLVISFRIGPQVNLSVERSRQNSEAISESINPETRKLAASTLTSPEFWEHPILGAALKTTGMLPAVAAIAIPGGLLADAVGASMFAAGAGGVLNAGAGLDEFYKKLDAMPDEELQKEAPKYRAMRELMDEKPAAASLSSV